MRNNGFTLIELIAVILILAIVLIIATPIINNLVTTSKEDLYEITVNQIIKGAEKYMIYYKHEIEGLTENDVGYILLVNLIEKGIINAPVINPITDEEFSNNAAIKVIVLPNQTYEYSFLKDGILY